MRGQHTIEACVCYISEGILTYGQLERQLAKTGRTEEEIQYLMQAVKDEISRRKKGNA